MATWLVTGGAGFIGANFVHTLARETKDKVIVLDALTYAGNLENIEACLEKERVIFVRGNICDGALVAAIFKEHDIDTIVNFAAESHVDRSITGPGVFVDTNVNGTYTLLKSATEGWAGEFGNKRFIQISTDEVFGDLEPDDPPFTENSSYRPSSPYSASKAAGDHLARAWYRTYGLPVIITNCSNNYGPWQFPEKFVPLMITNALDGEKLPLYGDGLNRRDWLHVEDHCEAVFTVARHGTPGETYLIGGGCELANHELLEMICDAVDTKLAKPAGTSARLISPVKDRPGHDRRYAINATWLRESLGWHPKYSIQESLGPLIDWYIGHDAWVRRIKSGAYRDFYNQQYGIEQIRAE